MQDNWLSQAIDEDLALFCSGTEAGRVVQS